MSINEIIIYIMVLFMLIGAVDKCIGGKLGLSENLKKVSWYGSFGSVYGWDYGNRSPLGGCLETNCRAFVWLGGR